MTKSKFSFSMIPPRTSGGNIPSSVLPNSTVEPNSTAELNRRAAARVAVRLRRDSRGRVRQPAGGLALRYRGGRCRGLHEPVSAYGLGLAHATTVAAREEACLFLFFCCLSSSVSLWSFRHMCCGTRPRPLRHSPFVFARECVWLFLFPLLLTTQPKDRRPPKVPFPRCPLVFMLQKK